MGQLGFNPILLHLIKGHDHSHVSKNTKLPNTSQLCSYATTSVHSLGRGRRTAVRVTTHPPPPQSSGTQPSESFAQIPTEAMHTRFLTASSTQLQPSCLLLQAEPDSPRGMLLHAQCFTHQASLKTTCLPVARSKHLQSQDLCPRVCPLPCAHTLWCRITLFNWLPLPSYDPPLHPPHPTPAFPARLPMLALVPQLQIHKTPSDTPSPTVLLQCLTHPLFAAHHFLTS